MLAAPHLEASAALEVVAVKLGKAGGRLDDSLLGLCFFFMSSWDGFGPRSAWRNLDTCSNPRIYNPTSSLIRHVAILTFPILLMYFSQF